MPERMRGAAWDVSSPFRCPSRSCRFARHLDVEVARKRQQLAALEKQYDHFLQEIGVLSQDMSEEDWYFERLWLC